MVFEAYSEAYSRYAPFSILNLFDERETLCRKSDYRYSIYEQADLAYHLSSDFHTERFA